MLWKGGEVTDLGVLPAGTSSSARSVNNHDQVVGESVVARTTPAFRWENGEMVELRGLGSGGFSFGRAINNRGQSVGESVSDLNAVTGAVHAVLWNDTDPTDLGTLPGDPQNTPQQSMITV